MTGFIGGLAAATFWASAGLCSARSSRLLGVFAAFAVTNLIGLVFIASVAIAVAGPPSDVSTHDLTLAVISGAATTIALASIFRAFRGTKIGLASAIVSADGAMAAGAAFLLFGERVTLLALIALGIITTGVAMVALRPGEGGRIDRATLGFALLGGVGFASALVASSRADGLDPLWVVTTGRVIGFLAVTVPFLLLRGGFGLPRVILPFVILSPVFDYARIPLLRRRVGRRSRDPGGPVGARNPARRALRVPVPEGAARTSPDRRDRRGRLRPGVARRCPSGLNRVLRRLGPRRATRRTERCFRRPLTASDRCTSIPPIRPHEAAVPGGCIVASGEVSELGKGKLSVLDVVAQSLGFIGPVFSAAFLLPSIAGLGFTGKGAGVASPFAIIIATIGISGVAWIVSRYAKRIHAAGALYDYVTAGFGQRIGFLAGWLYYGGMTMLTFAIYPAFGGFLALTLLGNHNIDISWVLLALLGIAAVTVMTILGVRVSTRAQLTIALVSVGVVLGYSIWVILKGGSAGNSADAFNPSAVSGSNILYGLLYATLIFTGFETAANLAEETENPRRSIPRAVMLSVLVVGVFYVIVMYALLAAFGFDMGAFLDLANFPQLYAAAATPGLGSSGFGELVQWIVVLDIFAVALGCANACSRGYFALARDRRLPRVLATVHPRFGTPWISALLLGLASAVVVIWTQLSDGIVSGTPEDLGVWFRFFQFGATFGALGLILVYLLISLTGFKGQEGEGRGGLLVAAIVGTAATLAATFGSVYKAPPVYALDKVWWTVGLWALIGVGVMFLLASRGVFSKRTSGQARTSPAK